MNTLHMQIPAVHIMYIPTSKSDSTPGVSIFTRMLARTRKFIQIMAYTNKCVLIQQWYDGHIP